MPLDRWCQLGGCRHHRRTSLNLILDQLCIALSSPLCIVQYYALCNLVDQRTMRYQFTMHFSLNLILAQPGIVLSSSLCKGHSTHYATPQLCYQFTRKFLVEMHFSLNLMLDQHCIVLSSLCTIQRNYSIWWISPALCNAANMHVSLNLMADQCRDILCTIQLGRSMQHNMRHTSIL